MIRNRYKADVIDVFGIASSSNFTKLRAAKDYCAKFKFYELFDKVDNKYIAGNTPAVIGLLNDFGPILPTSGAEK